MRVCYHIETHKDPDQILRLARVLRAGSPDCVIHLSHDIEGCQLPGSELANLGVVVSYDRAGYGDFSHVDRHLGAIEWIVRERVQVDWLVNISGQDFPLKPLATIEQELAETQADALLEVRDVFSPDGPWPHHRARSRYYFHHRRLAHLSLGAKKLLRPLQVLNRLQPLFRVHVSHGLMVGWRVRHPFGPEFRLHGGSAFMSLRRPAFEYLYSYAQENSHLLNYFRNTISPVEATFATILANAPSLFLENNCMRYFDFSNSRFGHPKTLSVDDLQSATASGAHFARKFEASDDEVYRRLELLVDDVHHP